jgi:branched-chain amino acid transport system substrate-binding protein
MTGSSLGQTTTIVNAIKMAFEEKNYKACNGTWTIQYEAKDDASAALGKWDPDVATANAKAYAADKTIVAVIGTFNSGAAKLEIPIVNSENLVLVSPANTYPGLTKPGKGDVGEPEKYYPNGQRNYTRVVPADDLQGAVGANWAKELGAKSVYVLDDQELYGKGIADVFNKTAKEIGLNVLGQEGIDAKAADYKALATKVIGLSPDLIYLGMITQNNAGQLVKDLRGTGYTGIIMGPDGIAETAFVEAAGVEATEGIYVTFGGVPPSAMEGDSAKWRDAYQAKYNALPEVYAVYGYVSATLLLDAFERVCASGKPLTDRAAVRDAVFATKDYKSVIGTFSIDANGDTSITTMSGQIIKNGVFVFDSIR